MIQHFDYKMMLLNIVSFWRPSSARDRLLRLMRQGGDKQLMESQKEKDPTLTFQTYEQFVAKHTSWKKRTKHAVTIFNSGRKVKPKYRIQVGNCELCYMIAPMTAMNYIYGRTDDKSLPTININKHMRYNVPDKLVLGYIFHCSGRSVRDTIGDMLGPTNPQKREFIESLSMYLRSKDFCPDLMFQTLVIMITNHGPGIITMPLYDDFVDAVIKGKDTFCEPFSGNSRGGHCLLVTGVERTLDEDGNDLYGGIRFEIQNSWEKQVFCNIHLNVFQAMGDTTSLFFLKQNLNPPRDDVFHSFVSRHTAMHVSSSPHRISAVQIDHVLPLPAHQHESTDSREQAPACNRELFHQVYDESLNADVIIT